MDIYRCLLLLYIVRFDVVYDVLAMATLPLFNISCEQSNFPQLSLDLHQDHHLLLANFKGTTLSIISRKQPMPQDHLYFMELSFVTDHDHFSQADEIVRMTYAPASGLGVALLLTCVAADLNPIERIDMPPNDRQHLIVTRPTYCIIWSRLNLEERLTVRFLPNHATLFEIQDEWFWLFDSLLRARLTYRPSSLIALIHADTHQASSQ
jgi:hypothetical protein